MIYKRGDIERNYTHAKEKLSQGYDATKGFLSNRLNDTKSLWKSATRGRDRRLNVLCWLFFYIFAGFLAYNLWNITYKFAPFIV